MAALTLLESAKLLGTTDDLRRAVIETFAMSTDILRVLPFQNIQGNAVSYTQESVIGTGAFRSVNASYTASNGKMKNVTEKLSILGGELDVDAYIVATQGMAARSTHEALKIKGIAQQWAYTFVKGDSSSSVDEFDGLQVRLDGNQLVSNSAGTGAALSLTNLDAAIDAVDSPMALLMSKGMRRRFSAAARSTTVGGYISFEPDQLGRTQTMYNGLPILIADENGVDSSYAPLAFNEAAEGGGSASTSIYVLSMGDGMLTGIQSGPMSVRDLGEIDSSPVFRTRIEHYAGIALWHPRAAARVYGITDAAITA